MHTHIHLHDTRNRRHYYIGLRDDVDDRWLRKTASKKRKEIVLSLFPHLAGSQLVISMGEKESERRERSRASQRANMSVLGIFDWLLCHWSTNNNKEGTKPHSIFTSLPRLYSPGANTCKDTHTHTGEALISGRKEYNEWVIKTQGRIASNLCPLSEHRSHDKRRISARQRRQAACAHWGDEIDSISAAVQGRTRRTDCCFFFCLQICALRRTNSNFSSNPQTVCLHQDFLCFDRESNSKTIRIRLKHQNQS